jgi:hypothetical protein
MFTHNSYCFFFLAFDRCKIENYCALSSVVPSQAPKQIFDSNHQNLRKKKAANFHWRVDPLVSHLKEHLVHVLTTILGFITLGACS